MWVGSGRAFPSSRVGSAGTARQPDSDWMKQMFNGERVRGYVRAAGGHHYNASTFIHSKVQYVMHSGLLSGTQPLPRLGPSHR